MGCIQQGSEPQTDLHWNPLLWSHIKTHLLFCSMWSSGGWRWVRGVNQGVEVAAVYKVPLPHWKWPSSLTAWPCAVCFHFSFSLKICFSVLFLFSVSVLFAHGSCRDQLWVWQRGLPCYYRWRKRSDIDIPVWEWGGGESSFWSNIAFEISAWKHCKLLCTGGTTVWKFIRFSLTHSRKIKIISYHALLLQVWNFLAAGKVTF